MVTLIAEEILKKQILPDIEALVLKHAPESELPGYYLCIYSPLEENFISQEIASLLHIASLVASDKHLIYLFQQERELILSKLKAENHPIYYLLCEHHKRLAWINLSYYLGTPWTMADFIDRVNEWITTEPNLHNAIGITSKRIYFWMPNSNQFWLNIMYLRRLLMG